MFTALNIEDYEKPFSDYIRRINRIEYLHYDLDSILKVNENYKSNLDSLDKIVLMSPMEDPKCGNENYKDDKKRLLDKYNKQQLDKIFSKYLDTNFIQKCFYCGVRDFYSYDHYLPKSKFPEFATNVYNLVLCCSHCQHPKGTEYRDHNNLPLFYHPFVNSDFNESYITIEVDVSLQTSAGLGAKVLIDPIMSIEPGTLLYRHFDALELNKKYTDIFIHLVNEFILEVREVRNENGMIDPSTVEKLLDRKERLSKIQGNLFASKLFKAIDQNQILSVI